ncbi:pilus assembly protein TadG-related protein [Brevundimonas variabilis]|uniref:pilus assembly protein TadG-related protein n=1 Tax=Brevundimonas variabilis TaxID=74312 RepID=UPI0031B58F0A
MALKFALAAPAVILLGVGAIDLNSVQASKSRLQDVADAAALAGAWELGLAIDDKAAIARAEVFVKGQTSEWAEAPTIVTNISVEETRTQRIIRVTLNGHRPSFFGSMLPPGGWHFHARASATTVGMTPLCVLVSGNSGSKLLNVKDKASISAPACLVHSNRDIEVEGGSIRAAMTQAVTRANGAINPAPGTGAAPIEDPFAQLLLMPPLNCSAGVKGIDKKSGIVRIPAGIHCGGIKVGGNTQLILEPGEHWFLAGALEVKENATLRGQDVVLMFDLASKFVFEDNAMVTLEGRRSGRFAGFVMAATRNNTQDFIISSDNVDSLLGVIYVPNATLMVDGTDDVARDSAWTVLVAEAVELKGSPSLIINANYAGSAVPVPQGVGPRTGGSTLVR